MCVTLLLLSLLLLLLFGLSLYYLLLLFQVKKVSSGSRDVLLISTERITGGSTPHKTEPSEPLSPHSISEEDGETDGGPARYFKYHTDDSTPPR